MVEAGRLDTVITKVKHVEVADKDKLLPKQVACQVEAQVHYNDAFKGYAYPPAGVKKVVKEIGTVEKYRAFFSKEPRMKTLTTLPKPAKPVLNERPMGKTA